MAGPPPTTGPRRAASPSCRGPGRRGRRRPGPRLGQVGHLPAPPGGLAAGRGLGGRSPGAPGPARRRPTASPGSGHASTPRRCRPRGGDGTGRSYTDRGKPGVTPRVLGDAAGVPLAARADPANRHSPTASGTKPDAAPLVPTPAVRRRKRTAKPHADTGDDDERCRAALRRRGIRPRIGRVGAEAKGRLGRHRRVVERTPAWPKRDRRPAVRRGRRADTHRVFPTLACRPVRHGSLDRL